MREGGICCVMAIEAKTKASPGRGLEVSKTKKKETNELLLMQVQRNLLS